MINDDNNGDHDEVDNGDKHHCFSLLRFNVPYMQVQTQMKEMSDYVSVTATKIKRQITASRCCRRYTGSPALLQYC